MERGPREVPVEMLPEAQRPLVLEAKAFKTRLFELQVAGKAKLCSAIDEYLMGEAKHLRSYADANFGTIRHLQKVPAWQAMMGGSLELTHPETPPELVAYVEERVRGMLTHIEAMIEAK